MTTFVEKHARAYVTQLRDFYGEGHHVKPLVASIVLSAGLLSSGHFFYQQDLSDQAVADRVALAQLHNNDSNIGVRFVLADGNLALGQIVEQNSLDHVEVVPFTTYHPYLKFIDYPVDYRPLFVNETPLKISVDKVVGEIISGHVDFRKRVAVTVQSDVVGLKDRYYVGDWLELHSALVKENRLAKRLIGRVFAVFDDGFYGILLAEVQDKFGERYPLAQKTIVFARDSSLTFSKSENIALRYNGRW